MYSCFDKIIFSGRYGLNPLYITFNIVHYFVLTELHQVLRRLVV